MKHTVMGQGEQVQVDVRIGGTSVCSIVFGAKSNHPFRYDPESSHAAQSMATGRILAATTLLVWHLLDDDNLAALEEFCEQLAAEQLERAGYDPETVTGDEEGDIPF